MFDFKKIPRLAIVSQLLCQILIIAISARKVGLTMRI